MILSFRLRRVFVFALFLAVSTAAFSANVSVSDLELMTWGRVEDDTYGLFSRAYMELLIEGGYKFGGRAEFLFDDNDLEEAQNLPDTYDKDAVAQAMQKNLLFKSVSVEMRRVFESPLSLIYFSGTTDKFASGEVFPRDYGAEDVASVVHGYAYFPTGILYDGIHTVKGTGFEIHTREMSDWMSLALYNYQDGYLGKGIYSSDLRSVFNLDNLKIETFLGATYPLSTYGIYRGGLLFYYSTGLGGEFFTQIGIPRWDPAEDDSFNIDLFYFLFEPRVRINLFSISVTFFWRPEYYYQTLTNESGIVDIYLRFIYGDLRKTMLSGGIENGLSLQTRAGEQIGYRVSPFLSLVTSGVIWDFKVNVHLYPYKLNELVETYVGIKTEL